MSNSLKLYEIAANVEEALMADEFNEEELTALVESMEKKAEAIVFVSDKISAFVDYCKSEEKRIAEKRKFAENRNKRILDYFQNCMDVAGFTEMTIGTKVAKIQKNPPKVVIDDADKLPGKFVVITQSESIDKKAIKTALASGEEVTGARIEQGFSLRIK